MKNTYFILCLLLSFFSVAQNSYKYEKEERIEKTLFPENALKLLEETVPEKARRVKYYKESDSVKISYETKLKYKGDKFSIEFDKNGTLEDVEVIIKRRHIPDNVYESIKMHLNDRFDSFRIKKIQRQYRNLNNLSPSNVLRDAFETNENHDFLYEIIAEVKTDKKRYFVEITFDKQGNFQLVRTIIQSSYDHILY